jgi:hypothetical protein
MAEDSVQPLRGLLPTLPSRRAGNVIVYIRSPMQAHYVGATTM